MERKRRSDKVRITIEARVLKQIRVDNGLSMRKAAELIGVSDTYINHIGNGRMDFPKGQRLERVLMGYNVRLNTFYERVKTYKQKSDSKEDLVVLIERMKDQEIEILLAISKTLLRGVK